MLSWNNFHPFHDIGKIGVPEAIINKPDRLTEEEYNRIKEHTVIGSEILELVAEFPELTIGARSHHERFDGRGYPDGLVGDEIPIAAQIVAVADVYDALVSKRCYKDAYGKGEAFRMIMSGECGVFSEKILTCLAKAKEDFEALADEYGE